MRQQLRREEQEEIRRAIESVRVYEDFIEEMQIRARENGTQNEAAQLEERRQTILQSVVITKYRPRKAKEVFEVIDLSGEVKGKDNEVIDLSGEVKGKAKNPNNQDEKAYESDKGEGGSGGSEYSCGSDNMFTNMFQRLSQHVQNASHSDSSRIMTKPREPGLYSADTCCICLEPYIETDDICYAKNDCGHEFHFTCLMGWLMTHGDCPTCRSQILPTEENRT